MVCHDYKDTSPNMTFCSDTYKSLDNDQETSQTGSTLKSTKVCEVRIHTCAIRP